MKTFKVIVDETTETGELKKIIEVYEELAAIKMQRIRRAILMAREFFEGLGRLSDLIGTDFASILPQKTASQAAIFISANAGLYGEIIDKTFGIFLQFVKTHKIESYVIANPRKLEQLDKFVVGKQGRGLMEHHASGVNFKFLPLDDDKIDETNFRQIIQSVLPYQKIYIFYGKFRNIAVQNPVMAAVSGELLSQKEQNLELLERKRISYLYEPNLTEISKILANEILSSLIEQTLRESQLSRYASRLMHLDQSTENINGTLKFLNQEKRRIRKQTLDKEQLNMISGVLVRGVN